MFKHLFTICISSYIANISFAQEKYARVAFYNLENLFDFEDDTLINDEEYLPSSMRNWSYYRYNEKSNRMAKAILSIGGWQAPDVVGVCEVENRRVLEDLVATDVLKKLNYRIIHFESPDRRGIDVGILYRPETVDTLFAKAYPVKTPDDLDFKTRDVLYVKMRILDDTLHYFVNHWPSRYGGQMQSEPKRILAAGVVRGVVDSIQLNNKNAKVVVMGDLNDSPDNISVSETLRGVKNPERTSDLKNLMQDLSVEEGSHRYQGEWGYLDQIIVSIPLLNATNGVKLKDGAHVHRAAFLMERDEKYPGTKPYRTFVGMRHIGGFSDHLPVFIDLIKSDKPNPKP